MTTLRRLTGVLALSLPFLCSALGAQQSTYNKLGNGIAALKEQTSIIRILANPDSFDDKRVWIEGFLHFEFEDSAIYLHQVDSDHMLSQNALWINLPDDLSQALASKLNNHYVRCEALFSAKDRGHMGAFAGELSDVRLLSVVLSKAELDKIVHGKK